ncbi:TIGR03083 family protein [Thermomonospora echinospora]|uniref:TIGR03083 family protein n=1 Tax=Thermomonospora echinospora TaxID=1992 RepID=A0A1H5XBR6_9ACTN|nr:maleylpyruvate isomerase family mycothiol-dependent enzyme [Thermomonospora echinospora]SEG09169.1 TIGR03083 family protein [Thermomonospora echinospora]
MTPTAEPTRDQVVRGLADEHATFAALVAPLSEEQWRAPTRCSGWQVCDVAAHVAANAVESVDGTIGGRSPDEQARALRGSTPKEIADLLSTASGRLRGFLERLDDDTWHAPSPVAARTIGNGILTLWYDTFVHHNDISAALGRPHDTTGPGLTASVYWLVQELSRLERGPLTLDLDGLPPRRVGTGGPTVTGDPMRFVLAASGRTDPTALGLDESVNVHLLR